MYSRDTGRGNSGEGAGLDGRKVPRVREHEQLDALARQRARALGAEPRVGKVAQQRRAAPGVHLREGRGVSD